MVRYSSLGIQVQESHDLHGDSILIHSLIEMVECLVPVNLALLEQVVWSNRNSVERDLQKGICNRRDNWV